MLITDRTNCHFYLVSDEPQRQNFQLWIQWSQRHLGMSTSSGTCALSSKWIYAGAGVMSNSLPEYKTSQSPYSLFFVGWIKRLMSEFFHFWSGSLEADVEHSVFMEGPYVINTCRWPIINNHIWKPKQDNYLEQCYNLCMKQSLCFLLCWPEISQLVKGWRNMGSKSKSKKQIKL